MLTLTLSARRAFDSPNSVLALEVEADAIHSLLLLEQWKGNQNVRKQTKEDL